MLAAFLSALCLLPSVTSYVYQADLSPRFQWTNNAGYCGEVSTIMAGLKYGQYLSQYDVRALAAKSTKNVQTNTQYLVGVNDQHCATNVRLNSIEYSGKTTNEYLAWAKKMIRQGYAVTITVYMNHYLFYGQTDPSAGDDEYDHIVSVYQIESQFDDDNYHDSDVLTLEDHGLWNPIATGPTYLFNYTFADFQGTRKSSNAKDGPIYTLPSAGVANYGITHTGATDTDGDLVPVRVATNVNYEDPSIKKGSETRPASMPIDLTITVSGLTDGVQYVMYWYTDEAAVPTSKFNANSKGKSAVKKTFSFTGTTAGTYTVTETIQSSDKAFFRAVRADAK